jgi:hypothetical protein
MHLAVASAPPPLSGCRAAASHRKTSHHGPSIAEWGFQGLAHNRGRFSGIEVWILPPALDDLVAIQIGADGVFESGDEESGNLALLRGRFTHE